MPTIDPKEVGARLRALYAEMQMPNVDKFGEMLGAERNRASNWLNGYNLPKPHEMARLCDITGVTLDWIYRGLWGTLPVEKSIRLQALMDAETDEGRLKAVSAPGAAKKSSRKKAGAT